MALRKLLGGTNGQCVHAAFIVDVCLNAVADQTLRRRPELLKSPTFRAEVAGLLHRFLITPST